MKELSLLVVSCSLFISCILEAKKCFDITRKRKKFGVAKNWQNRMAINLAA